MQTRAILKTWFETGDKPTEAQFEELIDSTFNLSDDKVAYNQIDPAAVTTIVNQASGSSQWNQLDW